MGTNNEIRLVIVVLYLSFRIPIFVERAKDVHNRPQKQARRLRDGMP